MISLQVSHALNHSATAPVFADDIVLYGNDEIAMTEYVETWRRALEDRGLRISIPKTQFLVFKFGEDNGQGREPVKFLGEELQRVHHVKYIGSSAEETGSMATEISQRVSAAWRNWKRCRGTHSEKNARCGHTREKKKRAARPKMERCM